MSDRERWIVYPLLFLALGVSLRAKVAPTELVLANQVGSETQPIGVVRVRELDTLQVRCENLIVKHIHCDTLNGGLPVFWGAPRIERPKGTSAEQQPAAASEKEQEKQ